MKSSIIKNAIGITGLLFATLSQASLSPVVDQVSTPVQLQILADRSQKAVGMQLAARTINRTSTNSSISRITSGSAAATSSPFFRRYTPSTAVGATIPAPGTGITPSPRVINQTGSWSNGFVRQYAPIKKRATFIPTP